MNGYKVVKTLETTRVVMKFAILSISAILVLAGVLPTDGKDVGFDIL
ncbi:hypothetical protein [Pyrobaculum aerophilum]|uniref:Uncharacterized protein n=1 Tax=Pyrobaculum aerophilum TaxID=13773 RepID=A0A832WEI5_9CREN|nr:hypothetical protein [Pyrobaculum aerophilum]HII46526.1 hypothetical protein [Pyrobaculum aerophilum]